MKTVLTLLASLALFSNISLAATGFYCEKDSRPVDGDYHKLVFHPTGFGLFDIHQSYAPGGLRAPGTEIPEPFDHKLVAQKIYCEVDPFAVTVVCSTDGEDIQFGVMQHNTLPENYLVGIANGQEIAVFEKNKDCYVTR